MAEPMSSTDPRQAVFLDRDGVLIENRDGYVKSWAEVEVLEQAVEACKLLSEAGYPIVVVTNQQVVGKGILTLEETEILNEEILNVFRSKGANIVGSYLCHHLAEEGCNCRKPRPGMLLQASIEHGIDLARSCMVGDALTDIQAADAAGVTGILVRTGRGVRQEPLVTEAFGSRCAVFDDMLAAASYILVSSGVQR